MNNWWIMTRVGEEYRQDLLRELDPEHRVRQLTGSKPAGVWYPIMAIVTAAMLATAAIAWRVLN